MIVDPKVNRNFKKSVQHITSTPQRRFTSLGSKTMSHVVTEPKKGVEKISKPVKHKMPPKRKQVTKGTEHGQKKKPRRKLIVIPDDDKAK